MALAAPTVRPHRRIDHRASLRRPRRCRADPIDRRAVDEAALSACALARLAERRASGWQHGDHHLRAFHGLNGAGIARRVVAAAKDFPASGDARPLPDLKRFAAMVLPICEAMKAMWHEMGPLG